MGFWSCQLVYSRGLYCERIYSGGIWNDGVLKLLISWQLNFQITELQNKFFYIDLELFIICCFEL